MAENHVIVDMTLIKLLKNCSLMFFDFNALNLFCATNGKTMINPTKHRKKVIVKGFRSFDKNFTLEAMHAAVKVPTSVRITTTK